MGNTGNCYTTAGNDDTVDLRTRKPEEYQKIETMNTIERPEPVNEVFIAEPEELAAPVEVEEPPLYSKPEILVVEEPADYTPSIAGNFIQGRLNGEGEMQYQNGNVYKGRARPIGK